MHVLQDGREWLHQSVFCSESLIVLNLPISSLSLAIRLSRSSTRSGLTSHTSCLHCPPTPVPSSNFLQPDTWTASRFCEISVCVTTSFLVILPPPRSHRPEEIRGCKPNFSSSLLFYCSFLLQPLWFPLSIYSLFLINDATIRKAVDQQGIYRKGL